MLTSHVHIRLSRKRASELRGWENHSTALAETNSEAVRGFKKPFITILSPSCKNLRITSPPLSLISFSPAQMSSSNDPKLPSSGPEIVPVPSKSPGRKLHPSTV